MKSFTELNKTNKFQNTIVNDLKKYFETNVENIEYKSKQEIEDLITQFNEISQVLWNDYGQLILKRLDNDKMQVLDKNTIEKNKKVLIDFYEFLAKNFS